jgi:hypothetical protein
MMELFAKFRGRYWQVVHNCIHFSQYLFHALCGQCAGSDALAKYELVPAFMSSMFHAMRNIDSKNKNYKWHIKELESQADYKKRIDEVARRIDNLN